MGIYPLHWLRIGFGVQATDFDDLNLPAVDGVQMQLRGGTDIQTDALVNFGAGKHGVLRCSSLRRPRHEPVVVFGEHGYLAVESQMHRPNGFTYKLWRSTGGGNFKSETELPPDVVKTVHYDSTVDGTAHMNGLADHIARLLRDGMIESDVLPLAESYACLRTLDAIRERGGLRYADWLESLDQ